MYIQRSSPPPNREETYSIQNFTGGLNNTSKYLKANEASELLNMRFADDELMEKRNGTVLNNFGSPVPDAIMSMFSYDVSETESEKLIYSTSSNLYVDGTEIMPVDGIVDGVIFQSKFFFVDSNALWVYGKFPQESVSPYLDVNGTPIDDYVVFRVINPGIYTPLDETHVRGVMNYDYDTMTAWYEPCELELEDAFKGANVLPNDPSLLCSHGGRLFASGSAGDNDNVFITDVQNPFYFPVSMPMQLPPNSDMVVSLIEYDNSVVVGRRHDVYVITGDTNRIDTPFEPFRLQRLNTHTGFCNQRARAVAHNYLFFLGYDGLVYALSSVRGDERVLSTTVISTQLDIFKAPISVLEGEHVDNSCAIFYKDEFILSIGGIVLVYSYELRAWTMYDNLLLSSMCVYDEQLQMGDFNGNLFVFYDGYLDKGLPYLSRWAGETYDADQPVNYKLWKEYFLSMDVFPEYISSVRVQFEIDGILLTRYDEIAATEALWDVAVFGDRFVNKGSLPSFPNIIGKRGRTIRVILSNGWIEVKEYANLAELQALMGTDVDFLTPDYLFKTTSDGKYYTYNVMIEDFVELPAALLDQPLLTNQMEIQFEFRGKR